MIKLNKVDYSYIKGTKVINDISFLAHQGKVTVLLGKNGQGKSTILKLIDKIYKCKSGDIFIEGKSIKDIKNNELAKLVSYVSQDNMNADITVFEAVMLGRIPHFSGSYSKEDLQIAANVINELNLNNISSRYLSTLSGGERQMVSIARALAQDSKIILLDEPMNNLDIENQIAISKLIKMIAKEKNKCVIVTMHDLNFSISLGDYFLFMKNHSIAIQGDKSSFTPECIKEIYGVDCDIIEYNKDIILKFKEN